ncbi:unnamed protein product [Peniophora sp. CBMAI 1063]|nr:unnamed protein product [Peniophora sp. CBMAI 1063]
MSLSSSSSSSDADFATTLVFIAFKPNDAYSPELFQRVVDDTRRKYHTICQWHGTTIEKPHKLYWYTATNTALPTAPTSALLKTISPLTSSPPTAFAITMHRPLAPVLRSPVTISAIMDLADGQPETVAEDMVNQTADMQHGMKGFVDWTYGISGDGRRVVYMGGWESVEVRSRCRSPGACCTLLFRVPFRPKFDWALTLARLQDSLNLASFEREEDARLVEAAEETFALFSSVLIQHVAFEEAGSERDGSDSEALDSPL